MGKELNKDDIVKLTNKEKDKVILDLLKKNKKLKDRIKKLDKELEETYGALWNTD